MTEQKKVLEMSVMEKAQFVNRAQEVAVLFQLVIEKLDVDYDTDFWKNFVQKYGKMQKLANEYRQELLKVASLDEEE